MMFRSFASSKASLKNIVPGGLVLFLLLAPVSENFSNCAFAKKNVDEPSLTPQQFNQLEHAKHMAKAGAPKANQAMTAVIATAQNTDQCLAIASYADTAGFTLLEARKRALQKGIELAKNKDDLIAVVVKARKLQCFDVTADGVKALLNVCSTPDDLYDLARRCQEISLNDVARLALEKIFAQTKNASDALGLARQARTLGLDDFTRKILHDVEDDCQTSAECMELLPQIEEFKYFDANRYILKKALEKATTVDELLAVNKAATRLGQQDIVGVSGFRGKKMISEQQAKDQSAADTQNAQSSHTSTGGF